MRLKYIIVCLLVSTGIANAQYQNYKLQGLDNGSKSYIGRDYVRLLPGYKYSASTGNTMDAKIQTGLTTAAASTFLAAANPTGGAGVTPDQLTAINTSMAVGQIPISSSVSASGAKCYNVPIEIVPGRLGFQPNISLSYNSQAGNGVIGMGWNISGLSSIEMVNKNMFFDGKNDLVDLPREGVFALDGIRLILKSTKLVSSNRWEAYYETVQGNTKITAYVLAGFDVYFKVQYPNGNVGTFGYENNISQKLSYPLTKLTNLNGSTITFSYDSSDNVDLNSGSTNEVYYINEINYGGIPNQASDFARIKFTFDTTLRPDQIFSLQSNKSCIYRKRLNKIECFSNPDLVKTYDLAYTNIDPNTSLNINDVSRLIQINCSVPTSIGGIDSLNPLKFYYGQNISPSVKTTPVTFPNENFNMAQVNAIRGKFDINSQNDALIVFPKKEAYTKSAIGTYTTNYLNNEKINVYQNVKDGSSNPCPITLSDGSENVFTTGDGFEDVFAANVDGKGQDEIVKVNMRFDDPMGSDWEYLTFNVYGVNSNKKLQLLNTYDYSLGELVYPNGMDYSVTPWKFYTGNFTGHGKTEVLVLSKDNSIRNKVLLIDLDGGGRNLFTQANLINTTSTPDIIYPMDIDGDGQTEIVDIRADQTYLYKFVDGAGFQPIGNWNLNTTEFGNNQRQIMFADLNGDGNIDIIRSPMPQLEVVTPSQKKTAPCYFRHLAVYLPWMQCSTCHYALYASTVKYITPELNDKFPNCTGAYPTQDISGAMYPIINVNPDSWVTTYEIHCPGCGTKTTYKGTGDPTHCWSCHKTLDVNHGCPIHGQEIDLSKWEYQPPSTSVITSYKDWIYQYTNGRTIVKTETIPGITRFNKYKYSVHEINGDDVPDLIEQTGVGYTNYSFDLKSRSFQQAYTSYYNPDLNNSYELLDYDINSGHSYSSLLALGSNTLISCEFPFNNTRSGMVSLMINSLGMADKTDYSQLSQGTNYTMGNSAVFPYTDYNGSMWVTSQTNAMYNKQIIENTTYSYSGAIAHKQGLGLLGFSSMVSTDLMKNKTVTTEFDPIHSGAVTRQTSDEAESSFTYDFSTWTNTKMKLLLTEKTVTDKLKGNTVSVAYSNFTDYGNAKTEVANMGVMTSTVTNTFEDRLGNVNLIGLLTKRVTSSVRGSNTFNQTDEYIYPTDNRLQFARKYIGTTMVAETEYKYNTTYGTVSDETVQNMPTKDKLTTHYEYSLNDQCSLWKKTDPFGLLTTYSYYSGTRLLKDVTDYIGNKVTYGYDNWRRRNTETSAYSSGTVFSTTAIDLKWNTDESEPKRLIYENTTTTNQPATKTYVDAFGRETRKRIVGFDGTAVNADKEYDTFGHLLNSSAPYKSNASVFLTNYQYDEYDRPINVIQPTGSTTSYVYDGNTIRENKDGIITYKTTDATGMLVGTTDNGGSVTYTYRADGQPDNVNASGVITSFEYNDPYNRQTKLNDPSAGPVQTAYNDASHTVIQTWNSGKNITTVTNQYGQPTSKTIKDLVNTDIISTYSYDSYGRPSGSTSTNGTAKGLTYEPTTGRLSTMTETVNGKIYQEAYGYDNARIGSITYNTGSGTTLTNLATVVYNYNTYGYLYQLVDGSNHVLRQINNVNELGQEMSVLQGNGLTTTHSYSPEGLWTNVTTSNNIQNMDFDFNRINGTLNSRTDKVHSLTENFTYDGLYRLKTYGSNTVDYSPNGNILNKKDVGGYTYPDNSKPYTLSTVTNTTADLTGQLDIISTVMSRPVSISKPSGPSTLALSYQYNDNYDRSIMNLSYFSTVVQSRYYFGGGKYEIENPGSTDGIQRLYLDGSPYTASIILEKTGSATPQLYYLHRDYLGSITQITDNSGNLAAEYSYDAWGRMRNPTNWQVYAQGSQPAMPHGGRGFTGHEQLNQFGLINMNARLYDPLLGRFLSPDPQVANPDETNGFNRYAYASNNPLMNVDINGEEGLPWWWLGGNNSSGGYQPDYNSNHGSNSGNNFHNNYSGPDSGNQGGGNSGNYGGNYGGNYSGNTTAAGNILFAFLSEIIYGSGSSGTNKPNPYVGLNFKPTEILSVTPARKTFTPLAKPVGTGASTVYSGGGNRRGGNWSSTSGDNWISTTLKWVVDPTSNIVTTTAGLKYTASNLIRTGYWKGINGNYYSLSLTEKGNQGWRIFANSANIAENSAKWLGRTGNALGTLSTGYSATKFIINPNWKDGIETGVGVGSYFFWEVGATYYGGKLFYDGLQLQNKMLIQNGLLLESLTRYNPTLGY